MYELVRELTDGSVKQNWMEQQKKVLHVFKHNLSTI